jgi:FkbM family methyltransferase
MAERFLPQPLLRSLRSWHYVRELRCATPDEEPDLHVAKHLVGPGCTAVDIGANIGLYTRFLSDWVGSTGSVWSIEPNPETYAYLTHSIRRLGLSNVRSLQVACSDRDGPVTLEIPHWPDGGENLYEARLTTAPGPSLRSLAVEARRLDSLLPDARPVFLKCDVEGHELECLRGARALLARCHPALLIEVSGDAIFEATAELGYRSWWRDGRVLRQGRPPRRWANVFFLTDAHAAALPAEAWFTVAR